MEIEEFFEVQVIYRCKVCEFTTPHKKKAIRHAWNVHAIEVVDDEAELIAANVVVSKELVAPAAPVSVTKKK
jgi:hypothetical protein